MTALKNVALVSARNLQHFSLEPGSPSVQHQRVHDFLLLSAPPQPSMRDSLAHWTASVCLAIGLFSSKHSLFIEKRMKE